MAKLWIWKGYTGCWICLNKPEHVLIMSMHENVSITLNMIEYAGIYLKKQSAQYARILNVSDTVVCGTMELRQRFRQKHQKKRPRRQKFWRFFYTVNGRFNPEMDTIKAFLSKIKTLFLIFKKGRWGLPSPPPSCAPVNVTEYVSITLNMSKYPWKCFNKLFWLY